VVFFCFVVAKNTKSRYCVSGWGALLLHRKKDIIIINLIEMKRFLATLTLLCSFAVALFASDPPTASAISQTPTDAHLFGHVVDSAQASTYRM
jgi:hypothetical protein